MKQAAETSSLGKSKENEFSLHVKMLADKISYYQLPSNDDNTHPSGDLVKLRLEIENHLSSALDAVDFVRHHCIETRKQLEEFKNGFIGK